MWLLYILSTIDLPACEHPDRSLGNTIPSIGGSLQLLDLDGLHGYPRTHVVNGSHESRSGSAIQCGLYSTAKQTVRRDSTVGPALHLY